MQFATKSNNSESTRWQSNWSSKVDRHEAHHPSEKSINLSSKQTINNNYTQLDALLADLKLEREMTSDNDRMYSDKRIIKDESSYSKSEIIPSTTTYSMNDHRKNIEYSSDILPRTGTSTYSNEHRKNIEYSSDILPRTGTSTYSNEHQKNIEFTDDILSRSGTNTYLNEHQKNIEFSDDILPRAGTKVTTIVRTYTYEIPGGVAANHADVNFNTTELSRSKRDETSHQHQHHHQLPAARQLTEWNTESLQNIEYNKSKHEFSDESNEIYKNRTQRIGNLNTVPRDNTSYVCQHKKVERTTFNDTNASRNLKGYFYCPYCSKIVFNNDANNHVCQKSSPIHDAPLLNNVCEKCNASKLPLPLNNNNSTNAKYVTTTHQNLYARPPATHTDMFSSTTKSYSHQDRVLTPFPVDAVDYTTGTAHSPLPNEITHRVNYPENEGYQKRELETAVATQGHGNSVAFKKPEDGVYYPPKYELQQEKMEASYSGGGQWAKASGSAEYSAGSKSKTKTKSGGAVVPVCLPLCCAMPCTIM